MFGLSDDHKHDDNQTDSHVGHSISGVDEGGAQSYSDDHTSDESQATTQSFWSDPVTNDDHSSDNQTASGDNSQPQDNSDDYKTQASSPTQGSSSDDLLGLKQHVLEDLAPLVNHLDQTPEEKFKTTMMLIQASDNSDLVKEAYAAANQIKDEKVRAQALLDVVNEINYFTHKDQA